MCQILAPTYRLGQNHVIYLLANHWQYSEVDTILKLLVIITLTFFDDGHRIKSLDLYQYVGYALYVYQGFHNIGLSLSPFQPANDGI